MRCVDSTEERSLVASHTPVPPPADPGIAHSGPASRRIPAQETRVAKGIEKDKKKNKPKLTTKEKQKKKKEKAAAKS